MSGTYPITTSIKVIKELQYVKESIKGITPDAPAFTAVAVSEFVPGTIVKSVRYIKLGAPDLTKTLHDRTDYNLSFSMSPVAPAAMLEMPLLESMINMVGSNSREDSYTFLLSQEHNEAGTLTEQYQIARGCIISSLTILVVARKLVTITSKWIANSIADWSSNHGLTGTPTFASVFPTGTPWSAIATGANPLVFVDIAGGESYDIQRFAVSINHNILKRQIYDQTNTVRADPTLRDIFITIDGIYKDDAISESVITYEPQEIKMHLNVDSDTLNAVVLTFTDVLLERFEEIVDSQIRLAKSVRYTGTASSVVISTETVTGPVTANSIQKYNMAGTVLVPSIHKYNLLITTSTVSQTSIHKYGMLQYVAPPQTSVQKYVIAGGVIETSIQKYNIYTTGEGDFDDDNFVSENFILD